MRALAAFGRCGQRRRRCGIVPGWLAQGRSCRRTNKLCLSCHDRTTINAANEDFGGIEGFNPHKAHLEAGDCTSCHSVDGTSTLSCNECHDAPLPEGWQSAERGSGPLHSLTK